MLLTHEFAMLISCTLCKCNILGNKNVTAIADGKYQFEIESTHAISKAVSMEYHFQTLQIKAQLGMLLYYMMPHAFRKIACMEDIFGYNNPHPHNCIVQCKNYHVMR